MKTTHKLKNINVYPVVHRWVSNPNHLNVMSNTLMMLGDTVEFEDGSTANLIDFLKEKEDRSTGAPSMETYKDVANVTEKSIFYRFIIG